MSNPYKGQKVCIYCWKLIGFDLVAWTHKVDLGDTVGAVIYEAHRACLARLRVLPAAVTPDMVRG